jgi:hypothetical protein
MKQFLFDYPLAWALVLFAFLAMNFIITGKGRPSFIWYDLWVGFFWDRKKRVLYVAPIPCIIFIFNFNKQ